MLAGMLPSLPTKRLPVAGEDARDDERGGDDHHGDPRHDGEDDELLVLPQHAPAQLDQLPAPSEAPHDVRPPLPRARTAACAARPAGAFATRRYRPCTSGLEAWARSPASGGGRRGVVERSQGRDEPGPAAAEPPEPRPDEGGARGQDPVHLFIGLYETCETAERDFDNVVSLHRQGLVAGFDAAVIRARRGRRPARRAQEAQRPSRPDRLRRRCAAHRAHAVRRHPVRRHRRRRRRAGAARRGQPAEEGRRGARGGAGRKRGRARGRQQQDRARAAWSRCCRGRRGVWPRCSTWRRTTSPRRSSRRREEG